MPSSLSLYCVFLEHSILSKLMRYLLEMCASWPDWCLYQCQDLAWLLIILERRKKKKKKVCSKCLPWRKINLQLPSATISWPLGTKLNVHTSPSLLILFLLFSVLEERGLEKLLCIPKHPGTLKMKTKSMAGTVGGEDGGRRRWLHPDPAEAPLWTPV